MAVDESGLKLLVAAVVLTRSVMKWRVLKSKWTKDWFLKRPSSSPSINVVRGQWIEISGFCRGVNEIFTLLGYMCMYIYTFFLAVALRPNALLRFLDITHNDAPQSVGLLWTSDQLVAETSTWQHTTLTTDKYPCPRWDSNPQSQQASGRRPTP